MDTSASERMRADYSMPIRTPPQNRSLQHSPPSAGLSGQYDPHDDDLDHGEINRYQLGDMDVKLEPEFYTAAFVSPLHLHQQRRWQERAWGEAFFTLGMLAVGIMQCLTVFGMSSFLAEKDSGQRDEFKLGTGLFVTGGATLSADEQRDLCGGFNHIGLHTMAGVNELAMPDGTLYQGTRYMPMFHSYKLPSGSWSFQSIGSDESYIDKLLRVVHDVNWRNTVWYFSNFRVEYGVLLVIMVGWLWFHVLYEFRKIFKFMHLLYHFKQRGFTRDHEKTTLLDKRTEEIEISQLTFNAFAVGCLSCAMRITVAAMMLVWGTSLLTASSNKLSLVLNSIAIGVVFELDVIIAYAVLDDITMQRIEGIKPISVHTMRHWFHYRYACDLLVSVVLFLLVFCGAMLVRKAQVDSHVHELHHVAALCLFAGPTPQAQTDIMAPVPGFCESLLSFTCAPNVNGKGSHHGPCLITDQEIFAQNHDLKLYPDEDIFGGMYGQNGRLRSMDKWGEPAPQLIRTRTWEDDQHLNFFRKVCMSMYHPEGSLDKRLLDSNMGSTLYSAPFYCPRDALFNAVFGGAGSDFDGWTARLDLRSREITKALDGCRGPAQIGPAEAEVSHAVPTAAHFHGRRPNSRKHKGHHLRKKHHELYRETVKKRPTP
jgi:hypothetical protein